MRDDKKSLVVVVVALLVVAVVSVPGVFQALLCHRVSERVAHGPSRSGEGEESGSVSIVVR